jgi:hypothetical protein
LPAATAAAHPTQVTLTQILPPVDARHGCSYWIGRLSALLPDAEPWRAAEFLGRLSAIVATAPWDRFTFEINPVKLGTDEMAALDALLVIN